MQRAQRHRHWTLSSYYQIRSHYISSSHTRLDQMGLEQAMRWAARVPWAALAAIQQAQGSAAYSCNGLITYSNSTKRTQIIVQSPWLRFKPPHEA